MSAPLKPHQLFMVLFDALPCSNGVDLFVKDLNITLVSLSPLFGFVDLCRHVAPQATSL